LTSKFDEYIGYLSTGTFTQTGGTHTVGGELSIGEGGTGVLNVGGGTLTASTLEVYGNGMVNITSAQAAIKTGQLTLGSGSTLTAVAGSQIHINGLAPTFTNLSRDENALAGLENVALVFDGNEKPAAVILEVAGRDYGATTQGFSDNFALGSLVVGQINPLTVYLFDSTDNGNRASPEALYVHDLSIGSGSTLNLHGFDLYYDGTLDNQGAITGGNAIFVPEPGTLLLLAAGLSLLKARIYVR